MKYSFSHLITFSEKIFCFIVYFFDKVFFCDKIFPLKFVTKILLHCYIFLISILMLGYILYNYKNSVIFDSTLKE